VLASKEEAEKALVSTSALYLACLSYEGLVSLCLCVASSEMADYVRAFWCFLDKNRNKKKLYFQNYWATFDSRWLYWYFWLFSTFENQTSLTSVP